MIRRAWRIALVLLLATAGAGSAQEAELSRVLDRLSRSWAEGDARAIAGRAARSGVSVAVDAEPVGPLGPRQTAAMLRRLFDDRETLSLESAMNRVVGGAPLRAFGELIWTSRLRGTTIPERQTVFLALIRENGAWRVTEIRLLR